MCDEQQEELDLVSLAQIGPCLPKLLQDEAIGIDRWRPPLTNQPYNPTITRAARRAAAIQTGISIDLRSVEHRVEQRGPRHAVGGGRRPIRC